MYIQSTCGIFGREFTKNTVYIHMVFWQGVHQIYGVYTYGIFGREFTKYIRSYSYHMQTRTYQRTFWIQLWLPVNNVSHPKQQQFNVESMFTPSIHIYSIWFDSIQCLHRVNRGTAAFAPTFFPVLVAGCMHTWKFRLCVMKDDQNHCNHCNHCNHWNHVLGNQGCVTWRMIRIIATIETTYLEVQAVWHEGWSEPMQPLLPLQPLKPRTWKSGLWVMKDEQKASCRPFMRGEKDGMPSRPATKQYCVYV